MSLPTKPLLAVILGLLSTAVFANVKAGDPFPAMTTAGLTGTLPATEGRVVLVDFWASWCAPCKASFPAYSKLQADYGTRGLVIVAVSIDESPAAYERFIKNLHPPFATVHDQAQQLVRQVNVPTMPTCYLIGHDGKVRFVHQGFHGEDSERELRKEIDTLLAEPANPS
jgi:thiol-disulfide isomerase/thioredoxin